VQQRAQQCGRCVTGEYRFETLRRNVGRCITGTTVIRSIEVGLMARIDLFAKIPLIGMSLVFLAMFIVAVTAYLHVGWYSIIGYAIAAVVAVAGFVMTFRDVRDTPGPPEQWDVRGTPIDPASPQT
jgi:energy-converting hydrogenase Eha subunit C